MASDIAKISVEKFDCKDQILFDFDKSKGLQHNVREICKKTGLPESTVYGLKHQPTKENLSSNYYVSEKNFKDVKHNDCLKVVFSLKFLTERIFSNINNLDSPTMRDICFEDLFKLSSDPSFIEQLSEMDKSKEVIDMFVNLTDLKGIEQQALLISVVHLFQKGYIVDTSKNILKRTLELIRNEESTTDELQYSLSLLHKILVNKNEIFNSWKETIIKELSINNLIPYIWDQEYSDLQYNALLLINNIIKYSKGDKKVKIIKEMNLKQNRQYIYNNIIVKQKLLSRNMEHELYVIQTYLLSLYKEALNSDISLYDVKPEFEIRTREERRLTELMDFDENSELNFGNSLESLAAHAENQHIRFSTLSNESNRTSVSSRKVSESESIILSPQNTINLVTLECLRYYKKMHKRNFSQSQIEENFYEPGIFVTSERIVKMLSKMLHIGMTPDSKSNFYQPIVFHVSKPFFHELFSRTMWLLSKTRREMKASTIEDYPKVMHILEKQVKMVLEKKPIDLKTLTEFMSNVTFKSSLQQMQDEKEREMRNLIENHPCIKELKVELRKENEVDVRQQRMNCLVKGAHFPKVFEKKTSGTMFVQLSKNYKDLNVYNVTNLHTSRMEIEKTIKVSDITHVVIGKNCRHTNLCQHSNLAFSLVIKYNHEDQLKFIAKDERNASYWTDALCILIGTEIRSEFFEKELNELVEMDIRLKLLELQNVRIPKNPPVLPPAPFEIKPPLPKKPDLKRLESRLNKTKK